MELNASKKGMIQAAVKKGLRDLRDDPRRGLRNLVDLGGMFAKGKFQQSFFQRAREELNDEGSIYYAIVEDTLGGTDTAVLTQFGMNLGYNCWTNGAQLIRMTEANEGFNVPWLIAFESGAAPLNTAIARAVISQGKELGIFGYALPCKTPEEADALLDLIEAEKDCAFFLFAEPSAVNDATAARLRGAKSALLLLNLDADETELRTSAAALAAHKCLRGGFGVITDPDDAERIARGMRLSHALQLSFYFLLHTPLARWPASVDLERQLVRLREDLPIPVVPFDFVGMAAGIDRNISSEACFAIVSADGGLRLANMENGAVQTGYDIKTAALCDILRAALPKQI